jgi:hypothetical protein
MSKKHQKKSRCRRGGRVSDWHTFSIHHMVPTSTSNSPLVYERANLKQLRVAIHQAWHSLFSNFTPFEVICHLIRHAPRGYFTEFRVEATWANSNYSFTHEEKWVFPPHPWIRRHEDWNLLFGRRTLAEVVVKVVEGWAPKGYFTQVDIQVRDGGRYTFHKGGAL